MVYQKAFTPLLYLLIGLFSFACNNKPQNDQNKVIAKIKKPTPEIDYTGNYVSTGYQDKAAGSDWVGVSVVRLSDSTIHVAVRSRIDIKKPTCTFDADAVKLSTNIYRSIANQVPIRYTFQDDKMTISAEDKAQEAALNYFCSGGASLADTYTRINGPLDEKQVDKSIFNKTLNLQNMGYTVTSIPDQGKHQLILEPYGLTINNDPIKMQFEGVIKNAEIEDLDADGFPEILIYVGTEKDPWIKQVIGFSPNKGKSLSAISFSNIESNPSVNTGYPRQDEFALVENTLVQRFKLYDPKGNSTKENSKIRQIQYKLKPGEASKQFVVDKVLEY